MPSEELTLLVEALPNKWSNCALKLVKTLPVLLKEKSPETSKNNSLMSP
jgi:hypothetical protein